MTTPHAPRTTRPRYARMENERRFIVLGDSWRSVVAANTRAIADVYLDCGRLRVRRLIDSDGQVVLKLTKKYGPEAPGIEAMVSVWLSPEEYASLAALPGRRITKTRHYDVRSDRIFSIDAFEGELAGLVMCSIETDTEAEFHAIVPPPYVSADVTADAFFTGGNLCRVTREELMAKLGNPPPQH